MNKLKEILKSYKKYLPFIIIVIVISVVSYLPKDFNKPIVLNYNEFKEMVRDGEVKTAKIDLNNSTFMFSNEEGVQYITDNPKDKNFKRFLLEKDIKVKEIDGGAKDRFFNRMMPFIPFIFLILIFQKSMKSSGIFNNKMNEPKESIPDIKFSSIAGNEEAKEDMEFLVNFLKHPKDYTDMGATLPKGVIFYGAPGTGKTLTAKAMAGEAGVPFFSVSGSDFVEMYVGMGAKRVRDLFEKAREKAPCIIFIDEIDAVGTKRGMDRNSEKDQTINALLNEMDGFSGSEGILVVAATNRVENLDEALIRPGRFDKHIAINLPDSNDRLAILKVYAKNKKLNENIDLVELSKLTIGFSGAGLETLLNEATIIAVNKGKKVIDKDDVDDAYFKTVMQGAKKKNNKDRNKKEIEIVAWHEAGHALVAKLLTDNDIPKVTIIPSTSGAGGVTFNIPKKMGLLSKRELINQIKVTYGGRIGELILLKDEDEITTGASQDIKQATERIFRLINDYGMTERFGMIRVSDILSDNKSLILEEATAISNKLYKETLELLTENKDLLKDIATALIEKETLNEKELDNLISSNQLNLNK